MEDFFPPRESDKCADLVFNVQIILGFNPCDLQNSHGDVLKGHSLRIPIGLQSIQGLIFFALLMQFLCSPESHGKLLQEAPKMACSITFRKVVISRLHPVQSVLQVPFSKMSCIPPKEKGFGHLRFSAGCFTSSFLLGFLFCLA